MFTQFTREFFPPPPLFSWTYGISAVVTPGEPPVISNTSWDDGNDEVTFTVSSEGTLYWSTYLAADGAPTLNSDGSWTGTTQNTGSQVLTAPSGSINITPDPTLGDRLVYGVIDGTGAVSNLIQDLVITFGNFSVTTVDSWSVNAAFLNYTRNIADLTAGTSFILVMSSVSSNDYFTTATLGGQAGTLVTANSVTAQADQGNSEYSQAWLFEGVSASAGDLVLNGSASATRRMSFALFAAEDFQIAKVDLLNTGTAAVASISTDVLAGDINLVTFGSEFLGTVPYSDVTGFTALQNVNQSNRPTAVGRHDVTATESPRVFSVTGVSGRRNVGLSVTLRPQ